MPTSPFSPTLIVVIGLVLILLVLSFIAPPGSPMNAAVNTAAANGFSGTTVLLIVGGLLLLLVVLQFMGFNLSYWLSPQAYKSSDGKPAPIVTDKQVFNIPGNHYTYDDAKAMCKAYNAELATYDQVEQAYNLGADWCNYGWSDGQMALFPTQKQT